MDRYIEKMLLVPEERWNSLLQVESRIDEKNEETPFLLETNNEVKQKGSESLSTDKKIVESVDKTLSPPGIPDDGVTEIEEDDINDDEPLSKYVKKDKTKKIKNKNIFGFTWKPLP